MSCPSPARAAPVSEVPAKPAPRALASPLEALAASPPEVLADPRRRRADWARQVADVLRRQVLQGAFADGMLPGEASLARGFGASRNAIRDALGILAAEGLVVRVQGVGTMVATRKYPHGLDRLLGLAETLREHGEVVNEVRTAGMIVPPPAVAARLRPPGGTAATSVVYIERLRRLNGLPFSLDLTYLAPDIAEPGRAAAGLGCPHPLDTMAARALDQTAARAYESWEVRVGAARALAAASPRVAVMPLVAAMSDPHADVRKAAATALAPMRAHPAAAAALAAAACDGDADVRAYARESRR